MNSTDGATDAGVDAAGEMVGRRVGQMAAVGVTVEQTGGAAGVTAVTTLCSFAEISSRSSSASAKRRGPRSS
jgi:hypothetical protein